MLAEQTHENWDQFLSFIKNKISTTEYQNWFEAISVLEHSEQGIELEVPNIFVQEYILGNYRQELSTFLPVSFDGSPLISFTVKELSKPQLVSDILPAVTNDAAIPEESTYTTKLNPHYIFDNFIEGPSNQFVKSAALGVASRPGKSYNPLYIHGGVGLGKTHILHSIAHYAKVKNKRLKVQCITTEAFINDLVDSLRNKSVDKLKRYYRSLDILIVDDIQFLQNRLNFEEEFCTTFESLINQGKQIIISSDKSPSELKLSQRLVARMEWGLVAGVGIPDLETRVAIILHKAEAKGFDIPTDVAFFIGEHIFNNVRQLEGAVNRLSAYCRLMNLPVTREVVDTILSEMLQIKPMRKITIDTILHSVGSMFSVKVSEIRGTSRTKHIALARQVAMYLAKELIHESLSKIASNFGGKTHSTLLHSWNKVKTCIKNDNVLRKQVQMTRQNIESS